MIAAVRIGQEGLRASVDHFEVKVELVLDPNHRDDPSLLAGLALAYAATQLIGMSVFGIDTWTRRADAFGVYFNLFSRLSPLECRADRLGVRKPLSALAALKPLPGSVPLVAST